MKIKRQILTIGILLTTIINYSQNNKNVNINYMLRGEIYANSSIVDSTAAGGFGGSDNSPKAIKKKFKFEEELFLKIDTTKIITIGEKYNGYKLYIGNKSDSIKQFLASDSRLDVIAEVNYKNEWQPIIYLPSSWCGNSYHILYLKPNEYWGFEIPKFEGKIKTKIRYRLTIGNDKYIYSNEILTFINKGQFKKKKKYSSNGIMDPYND